MGNACGLASANRCSAYVEAFDPICNPDGWCFEQPTPFDSSLKDIAANSANDIWMVGSSFTWAHWNGSRWSGGFDARRGDLNDLWLTPSSVWAVTSDGNVVKRAAGAWVNLPKPTNVASLETIFGFSENDVWAGGTNIITHWNGTAWANQSMPGPVKAIWGAAPNDVWAVGEGFMSRWNGTTWTAQAGVTWKFRDVAGAAANDVWAVADGHVMRFNGTFWTDVANDSCSSVWVGGPNAVAMACYSATNRTGSAVKTWNGSSWTQEDSTTYAANRVITGVGSAAVATVSEFGVVERRVGSTWTQIAPVTELTNNRFVSVQSFSNGDGLAFDSRKVFARIGGVWSVATTPTSSPESVFGFSATDYLVGASDLDVKSRPIAYRVTAGVTTPQDLGSFTDLRYPELNSMWASSPTDVHAVGQSYWQYFASGNYIGYGAYHSDGSTWTAPLTGAENDSNADSDLFLVHGSSSSNVWAIDHGRSIWRLLSGTWARVTTGSPLAGFSDSLTGLWVQSNTKTWLGGTFGVLDFDAATGYGVKRAVPQPALPPLPTTGGTTNPHVVRGFRQSPSMGLIAIGSSGGRGVSWWWDGSAWQVQSVFPYALWAIDFDGSSFVAVGDRGHIYRRR